MMKSYLKKSLKIFAITFVGVVVLFFALMYFDVIWRSPKYFEVKEVSDFAVPIMTMEAYDTMGHHSSPYIYKIGNSKGSVYILGISHTKDTEDPQIDSIRTVWETFKPDVALVEGRLGFLFSWIQDAVAQHGEGGETVRLAKKHNVPFFTWEPVRQTEVDYLLEHFNPKLVASFYALRPYFSNFRFGKPENPNEKMNDYIRSRTDYDGIRGLINDFTDIDSIWLKEVPGAKDWRDTSDEYGWPEGYFSKIAALSNQFRDIHMCSIINELVNNGNKVFVTMGASHAFRIEKALKFKLQQPTNSGDQLM